MRTELIGDSLQVQVRNRDNRFAGHSHHSWVKGIALSLLLTLLAVPMLHAATIACPGASAKGESPKLFTAFASTIGNSLRAAETAAQPWLDQKKADLIAWQGAQHCRLANPPCTRSDPQPTSYQYVVDQGWDSTRQQFFTKLRVGIWAVVHCELPD